MVVENYNIGKTHILICDDAYIKPYREEIARVTEQVKQNMNNKSKDISK